MNNIFYNLRKLNENEFISEEEKARISSVNFEILKAEMGSYENPSSRIPDYFINNIFAKSTIENYFRNNISRDNYEFHKKSFDKYFVNYSNKDRSSGDTTLFYHKQYDKHQCILHDKKNKAYLFSDEISDHNFSTFTNSHYGSKINILPEFEKDEFYYSEVLFSAIANYSPEEEIISRVNKMFSSAIECFDGEKISNQDKFRRIFDLIVNLSGSDGSYRYKFGYKDINFINSHKEVRSFFNFMSSRMVYFDISSDYNKSEELKIFAKTCYEMVKSYSCSTNNPNNIYYILFTTLISCRNITKNYKPINYSIVNDSVISIVVELAHIYAEKNNLDLISKEVLESIFLGSGRFCSEYISSFKHAVVYSSSIRNNSMLNFVLSPKNLKKIYYFNRKILYSAAIMSGNLNDNLIARISAEKCIIDDFVSEALMISRFFYKDSKILRKMSSIKWCSGNYKLLILFISFLEKNDIHILMSLNVAKALLYPGEFDVYQRIMKLKIESLES